MYRTAYLNQYSCHTSVCLNQSTHATLEPLNFTNKKTAFLYVHVEHVLVVWIWPWDVHTDSITAAAAVTAAATAAAVADDDDDDDDHDDDDNEWAIVWPQ